MYKHLENNFVSWKIIRLKLNDGNCRCGNHYFMIDQFDILLLLAAKKGGFEEVKEAIENGADINARDFSIIFRITKEPLFIMHQ